MRMSAKQFRRMNKTKSKYGNRKVEYDGEVFDSQAEARYYQELKLRERAEEILFFRLQPRYRLQDGFEKNGKRHRPIDYIADFEIHHKNGEIEVVDVKGFKTEVFKIKQKMFERKYPHKLTLIQWKRGQFVEV